MAETVLHRQSSRTRPRRVLAANVLDGRGLARLRSAGASQAGAMFVGIGPLPPVVRTRRASGSGR